MKLDGINRRVAAAAWVDAHEKTLVGDRTKSAANDPMDVNERKQFSWSEAEKSGAADIMHKKILEQMQCLCRANCAGDGEQNGR